MAKSWSPHSGAKGFTQGAGATGTAPEHKTAAHGKRDAAGKIGRSESEKHDAPPEATGPQPRQGRHQRPY